MRARGPVKPRGSLLSAIIFAARIDRFSPAIYNPPMSVWAQAWTVYLALVALVWIIWLIAIYRAAHERRVLSSRSYPTAPESPPRVSVLVAAKDEQDHIETCVTGLLAQDYPNFELIVIDDRSDDQTPVILRRLQQEAGDRLKVVTVSHLLHGWFGKSHAMHQGVGVSTGDWLLFTDADCCFRSPAAVSMAMREALAEEVDFLSVTPILETRTTWERIIQPVCTLMLMVWFVPHRVNRPNSKAAYANGAFMLLHRSCYDTIGGHKRVRAKVGEDIQLARIAKRAGLRLRVVENDDLYSTRMYDSFARTWHGWGRIFYGGLASRWRLSVTALMLILFSIGPWAALLIAGFLRLSPGPRPESLTTILYLCLGVVALEQFAVWWVYRVMHAERFWSFAYILGVLVTLGILFSAMFKAFGASGTTWRGTAYRGGGAELRASTISTADRPLDASAEAETIEEPAAHA